MGLAHLHFRHPEKDFARIEIAKNPPLELQKKWRMKRVTQVEQRIRTRQTFTQFAPRHSDAAHSSQVVHIVGRRLIKQTVAASQSMLAQAAAEICGCALRPPGGCPLREVIPAKPRRDQAGASPASIAAARKNCLRLPGYFAANPQPRKIVTGESRLAWAIFASLTSSASPRGTGHLRTQKHHKRRDHSCSGRKCPGTIRMASLLFQHSIAEAANQD